MLIFYAAKIIPAQHKRDQDKDESFARSIAETTARIENQTKLFAEVQRSLLENFRTETQLNREQDKEVREHHKQIISDISAQTREALEQNMKFLQANQDNHRDHREQTKIILDSIRSDILTINEMINEKLDLVLTKIGK